MFSKGVLSFSSIFICIWCFPISSEAEYAYFLLNSECTNAFSCTGEIHDVSVVCLNSKCICDPRLGIYDPLRYQCVGKADHVCLGDRCTRNSYCDATTNTCKCHAEYQLSPDGRCVQGYDGVCDEDEDCKRGFLCYDGKCECRYPNHQYYHKGNDTCYSIAQSWDANFRKANSDEKQTGSSSTLYLCFEILFVLAHIAVLVAIAVFLAKIGKLLRDIIVSFKLHGYFLRTSLDGRSQDTATVDTASFFDGVSKV